MITIYKNKGINSFPVFKNLMKGDMDEPVVIAVQSNLTDNIITLENFSVEEYFNLYVVSLNDVSGLTDGGTSYSLTITSMDNEQIIYKENVMMY